MLTMTGIESLERWLAVSSRQMDERCDLIPWGFHTVAFMQYGRKRPREEQQLVHLSGVGREKFGSRQSLVPTASESLKQILRGMYRDPPITMMLGSERTHNVCRIASATLRRWRPKC